MSKMNEYESFLKSDASVPRPVSSGIFEKVSSDLNPDLTMLMKKLGLLYGTVGSLSLLLCAQFGVGRGHMLAHALMSFGELACFAVCGALFIGSTSLAASLVLSRPELRKIRNSGYLPVLVMGVLSLLVFFCFGADVAPNLALVWLVGGMAAAVLINESAIQARRHLRVRY